jgi:hypothetical protein
LKTEYVGKKREGSTKIISRLALAAGPGQDQPVSERCWGIESLFATRKKEKKSQNSKPKEKKPNIKKKDPTKARSVQS